MKDYNGFTHAQRLRALRWLQREYAEGRRTPPTVCDACGQTEGVIEAHSEDYSEPYGDHTGQFGLCYLCHMMLHCRFSSPARFNQYADVVAKGWRIAEPFRTRNFHRIRQFLDGTWKPQLLKTSAKMPTLLVDICNGKFAPPSR